MSKRSDFKRIEKDRYFTTDQRSIPSKLVDAVRGKRYAEPCYGEGDLEDLLMDVSTCVWRSDIVPFGSIKQANALDITKEDVSGADMVITNPPWSRPILHRIIWHFLDIGKPAWYLFDADWMHTKQSSDLIKHCKSIISVGRLTWIPGTKTTGKDNCAWYNFDPTWYGDTRFYGRQP